MRSSSLVFHQKPSLHQPYLIASFAGWPNAAEVSTQAVLYLIDHLQAKRLATFETEAFYNLIALRPHVRMEKGVLRRLRFPSNCFFFWKEEGQPHDLVLFMGFEPHYGWQRYIELIASVATEMGVTKCIALGSFYDQVPHSRSTRITAVINTPELRGELETFSLDFSNYRGPTSIQSSLLMAMKRQDIAAVSLWAHAPYYIQLPNIKVCYGLLLLLSQMLHLPLDLSNLAQQAQYMDLLLTQAMQSRPQLAEHIKQLEELYEAGGEAPVEQGLISEIEEFLRQIGEGDN